MIKKLRVDASLPHPDEFYELLVDMHRDLTEEQSKKSNAKLILLLANHIGDPDILAEAIAIAHETI